MKWLNVAIENQQYVWSLDSRNSFGRETKGFHESLSDVTKASPLSLEISIFLIQPLSVWCYTPFEVSFDKPKKILKKVRELYRKRFFFYIYLAKWWPWQNDTEVIFTRLWHFTEIDTLILPAKLVLRLKVFWNMDPNPTLWWGLLYAQYFKWRILQKNCGVLLESATFRVLLFPVTLH